VYSNWETKCKAGVTHSLIVLLEGKDNFCWEVRLNRLLWKKHQQAVMN